MRSGAVAPAVTRGHIVAALLVAAAAAALAPVAGAVPLPSLVLGVVAAALVAIGYTHPPAAAYVVLAVTPLTAGLGRSALIPLLRPHEAVALALGTGVALRAVAGGLHLRPAAQPDPLGLPLVLMVAASSVLPLLWMVARGLPQTQDDLLYAAAIAKFAALYLLIRTSVRAGGSVAACLWVTVAAGALVAVVAILQSLQVAGIPQLVFRYYGSQDLGVLALGRGSSTLGSSIAAGDVMVFDLAICLGWLLRAPSRSWLRGGSATWRLLPPLVLLFTAGALASGQVSALIGLVVAVAAVAYLARRAQAADVVRRAGPVRLLTGLGAATAVGAVLLWPVIHARLVQFDTLSGLPRAWQVRLDNLTGFVWPQLFSGYNWLFGVRPSARIRADVPWGPYIYVESGHTWLLWTGGIPLALAFLYFMWVAVRTTARAARTTAAPGVAATASFASLLVVFVLMSFDPHITMRGTADLLFSLLAMAVPSVAGEAPPCG